MRLLAPTRLRQALAGTAAVLLLAGCGASVADTTTSSSSTSTSAVATSDGTTVDDALADDVAVETGDTSYDEADAIAVTLDGTTATSDSDAVSVEDGTVTITAAGTYGLTGELTGQVVVDSAGDGVVRLVLDDATITSETTSAISVVDAESVVVVLADGSDNALADASTYADTSEDAPTGTLYSTADLTIGGSGSLTVTGRSNNGIVGKDGLVITGGTIDVTSVDDGILGKDYLVLTDGTVTVDAVGDTFKSDNTEDAGSGFVLIEGGDLTVTSQDDGIKGVQVLISGGTVEVAGSNEALEGSLIIIDDGDIELHSADDGVNAATSDDSAATDGTAGQMGGGGEMQADTSLNLYVNGGSLEVWASGDGLDSNGNATITGGDILVHGPTTDGNGALDVNGTFEVSGGTLLATGSAGMVVAPSTDSAQGWIATTLASTAAAGSEVVITDADGTEVATYAIEKDAASVVYSGSGIEQGATYTVTVDGTDTTVTAGEAPAGGRGGPMGG
ncbi:carbohydrate-binding domain-containing protein [Nocardioides glacieisoli]|uniref:Carbohydrate-binding domain-containing protein n=1 Tax=Nocardioides glacieisoli TaxID=1168730 RepID=A0A4Q2RLY7_9ACTN|nr:carbohydrate-binding domain-containing protein [Nocardioides glacieisoli]RYB89366.1 carbohydrate-binding domain-containing protein [Nocardioides glacieisoli]